MRTEKEIKIYHNKIAMESVCDYVAEQWDWYNIREDSLIHYQQRLWHKFDNWENIDDRRLYNRRVKRLHRWSIRYYDC